MVKGEDYKDRDRARWLYIYFGIGGKMSGKKEGEEVGSEKSGKNGMEKWGLTCKNSMSGL